MVKKRTKNNLKAQKARLMQERERLVAQIEDLKDDDPFLDPDHASDNAAVDTDVREQIGHETIEAEVKDLQRRVRDIDLALKKTEAGEYGYCERCHNPIPTARLALVPEARYCVDCESKLVR